MISARTKAALAAAKARGVKLGGDRGGRLTANQSSERLAGRFSKGRRAIGHLISYLQFRSFKRPALGRCAPATVRPNSCAYAPARVFNICSRP
jgi:DNA invertase Pin-like site-specific DNA recombinase